MYVLWKIFVMLIFMSDCVSDSSDSSFISLSNMSSICLSIRAASSMFLRNHIRYQTYRKINGLKKKLIKQFFHMNPWIQINISNKLHVQVEYKCMYGTVSIFVLEPAVCYQYIGTRYDWSPNTTRWAKCWCLESCHVAFELWWSRMMGDLNLNHLSLLSTRERLDLIKFTVLSWIFRIIIEHKKSLCLVTYESINEIFSVMFRSLRMFLGIFQGVFDKIDRQYAIILGLNVDLP